jgi:hypothetical protein
MQLPFHWLFMSSARVAKQHLLFLPSLLEMKQASEEPTELVREHPLLF